ncbi:MAG: (d)CMP kinase [Ruminococcaceae bacterium]|nr:(d)CMP kinase [Oscillospiraceae bacterium]
MKLEKLRVALDGPGGAGKSTVAKAVAAKTGLIYVDTGSLYRTVGLYMARHGIDAYDVEGIIAALPQVDIKLTYEDGKQCVSLCGEQIGDKIRTEEASYYASAVSKIPEVRAFLLDMQRSLGDAGGVIMDGRDIGTVIMPDAEIKVFMTATVEERARRRFREQQEKGIDVTFEDVLSSIIARDKQDSEREAAPLKAADDAIIFVNDGHTVETSAEHIIGLMQEYVAKNS